MFTAHPYLTRDTQSAGQHHSESTVASVLRRSAAFVGNFVAPNVRTNVRMEEGGELAEVQFADRGTGIVDGSALTATADAPKRLAGGSLLSQIWQESLKRLDAPDVAEEDGRGWDTSTEPKNMADMMELAKKQV